MLHVDLASKNFLALGPKKRFNQGVSCIAINPKTQELLQPAPTPNHPDPNPNPHPLTPDP